MKAMILAAGLGTRLKQHTLNKPKALVEIEGKPLLAYVLEKLVNAGFTSIVVNVHHFAEQIIKYLQKNDFGTELFISDESDRLLNTGGGILNAKHLLSGDDPFLVHNVDILSDIDLLGLMSFHAATNSLATLAVGNRNSSRKFLFDELMHLVGWKNNLTGKTIISRSEFNKIDEYAFAGIHVISPVFFELIKTKGAFSIVDAYLNLCKTTIISGFETSNNFVLDVGKAHNIEEASNYVLKKR